MDIDRWNGQSNNLDIMGKIFRLKGQIESASNILRQAEVLGDEFFRYFNNAKQLAKKLSEHTRSIGNGLLSSEIDSVIRALTQLCNDYDEYYYIKNNVKKDEVFVEDNLSSTSQEYSQEFPQEHNQNYTQEHTQKHNQNYDQEHIKEQNQNYTQEHNQNYNQNYTQEQNQNYNQKHNQNYDQEHIKEQNQNYTQEHTQEHTQKHNQNYTQKHNQNYIKEHNQNYIKEHNQNYTQEHIQEHNQNNTQEHQEGLSLRNDQYGELNEFNEGYEKFEEKYGEFNEKYEGKFNEEEFNDETPTSIIGNFYNSWFGSEAEGSPPQLTTEEQKVQDKKKIEEMEREVAELRKIFGDFSMAVEENREQISHIEGQVEDSLAGNEVVSLELKKAESWADFLRRNKFVVGAISIVGTVAVVAPTIATLILNKKKKVEEVVEAPKIDK